MIHPVDARLRHTCLALVFAIAFLRVAHADSGAGTTHDETWQAAWGTAMQSVPPATHAPLYNLAPAVAGRTVREVIQVRTGGTLWRLRLSNRYGETPVTITAGTLAQARNGAALAGTPLPLTFGTAGSVTLAPGEERLSDPIAAALQPGPLSISLAIDDGTAAPRTWHKLSSQVTFVAAGDRTKDRAASAFHIGPTSWLFMDMLLVATKPPAGVIVAIGDSITDGMRSTLNANARWPDRLAERLAAQSNANDVRGNPTVVNMGISGNRLLSDSPCYGKALRARFDHDALEIAGARDIILLIGINDINFQAMPPRAGLDCDFPHTKVTAVDLIDGYKDLIMRAHRAGKRLTGATLTPASLPPDREKIRLAVNRWIRGGNGFDSIIDFDQALRDPVHPSMLLRKYDSGDHIHPNDAGYRAMAAAIPLPFFAD